jgi:hypothetical protein
MDVNILASYFVLLFYSRRCAFHFTLLLAPSRAHDDNPKTLASQGSDGVAPFGRSTRNQSLVSGSKSGRRLETSFQSTAGPLRINSFHILHAPDVHSVTSPDVASASACAHATASSKRAPLPRPVETLASIRPPGLSFPASAAQVAVSFKHRTTVEFSSKQSTINPSKASSSSPSMHPANASPTRTVNRPSASKSPTPKCFLASVTMAGSSSHPTISTSRCLDAINLAHVPAPKPSIPIRIVVVVRPSEFVGGVRIVGNNANASNTPPRPTRPSTSSPALYSLNTASGASFRVSTTHPANDAFGASSCTRSTSKSLP